MKSKAKSKAYEEVVTFKISSDGRELLDLMADQDYKERSRFIRSLITAEAKRRDIEIPEVVKYEST